MILSKSASSRGGAPGSTVRSRRGRLVWSCVSESLSFFSRGYGVSPLSK